MCHHCGYRPIAPGKQKYCRTCAHMSKTVLRQKRRAHLKAQGAPLWQRNGWASEEQYHLYHRRYMQQRRAK